MDTDTGDSTKTIYETSTSCQFHYYACKDQQT